MEEAQNMSVFDLVTLYKAPKIELHVHLEGSLSLTFWRTHKPFIAAKIESFKCNKNRSLRLFLDCFREIHKALSSPSLYYLATIDFLSKLVEENIKYVEFTWSPGGFWKYHNGNPIEVYKKIKEAINLFKPLIEAKILIDFVRSHPIHFAEEIGEWLIRENPSEVVGVSLGGDESNYDIDLFVPTFEKLKAAGFPLTIHAGEVTSEEVFLNAINIAKPKRVGHATAIQKLTTVQALLKQGIHIEACPSSNEILNNLSKREDHPIFVFQELRGSIHTDDRSFFSQTLSEELFYLLNKKAITALGIAKMQLNAVEDSFYKGKSSFLTQVQDYWSFLQR